MKNLNSQIDAYLKNRKLKYHEIETLKIIKNKLKKSQNILDIGCANGNFLFNAFKINKNANYCGVDISKKLINLANKNNNSKNISFKKLNIDKNNFKIKFDIVLASGIMSNYENFKIPLKNWIKLLNKGGMLVVFGCFNSSNIDTISKIRNNYNNSNWQNGLTSYSITTVGKFLEKLNIKYKFISFDLPIDIKKNKNPIRSFTIKTIKNRRIIVTGANIINEFYHLIIKK